MQEKGIIVAIGTDGCSSNNNLDMLEEIKIAAIVNKGERLNPLATPTSDVLTFATKNGAYAQKREDCGKLKVGNKADLVVIDANKPSMQPIFDSVNNVVYSANGSDVELTMIDGKIVYEKGEFKTIDIEKAMYMVNKSAKRIVEELKA